jgi:hypothetical protein
MLLAKKNLNFKHGFKSAILAIFQFWKRVVFLLSKILYMKCDKALVLGVSYLNVHFDLTLTDRNIRAKNLFEGGSEILRLGHLSSVNQFFKKEHRLTLTASDRKGIQGVPTQTVIFHFALAGRNMQASFGLKVIWES